MPPGPLLGIIDSLGERVKRKLSLANFVKCFNTVPYGQMFRPAFKDVEMLICGNDKRAKEQVTDLLVEFGWKDALDIGGSKEPDGWRCWCRCGCAPALPSSRGT
jgi:hypothetical protein